jgi:hypothetical protein
MNELTLDGKIYVSSKRAAEMTGYAKDYVGQLCREGRVEARLVGRNWYILKSAIEKHRFSAEKTQESEDTQENTHMQTASWDKPQYKIDEPVDLPAINRLAEASQDIISEEENDQPEPVTTIEAMQEAWRSWFTRDNEDSSGSEKIEIVQEAEISFKDDEVAIPLKQLDEVSTESQALNLRRIRDYNPEEARYDEGERVIITETPRKANGGRYYRTIQIACGITAIIAICIGYVGSGFLKENMISYRPVDLIAGVSVYNNTNN